MNKVILIGNLGRDAELRFSPSGTAVANMSMATTERWKDSTSGEAKSRTEWHRVIAFGKLAEMIGKLYRKGKAISVEGRLQTRKWEDKDKITRWTTEIIASQCRLLGPAPAKEVVAPPPETYNQPPATSTATEHDDEIPF